MYRQYPYAMYRQVNASTPFVGRSKNIERLIYIRVGHYSHLELGNILTYVWVDTDPVLARFYHY